MEKRKKNFEMDGWRWQEKRNVTNICELSFWRWCFAESVSDITTSTENLFHWNNCSRSLLKQHDSRWILTGERGKKELRQTGEKREQRSSHGLTRRKEDYTWLYQTRHVMSSTIHLMQQQRYQKLTSTLASLGGDPGWGSSGGESCPVLPRGPMASPPLMASGGEILAVDVAPSDSAPVGLDRPDAPPAVALEGLLLLPPCAVLSLLPLPVILSRSSSSPVIPLLQTRQESAWKCVRMTMAWQTSEIDQFSSIPRVNRWMCWDVTCHGRWARNLFRSLRSLNFLGAKSNPRSHLWSPS